MAKRPPNILLTIADDQRGSALGCVGTELVATPALDFLARRGTRFKRAQHLGSCHGAVCAPSRAMLHTGLPYFQLDQSLLGGTYPPQDRETTIPKLLGEKLGEAGYYRFATGKWHNGVQSFHRSFDDAANIFFGGMNDHWFTPVHGFDPSGHYPPEAACRAEGFSTEVFAQSAIEFIHSRRDNDQPIFCYCAFTAPHDPRTPPDEWMRKYCPSDMVFPPNIVPRFFGENSPSPPGVKPALDNGTLDQRDELLLGTPRDAKELQRALAAYYGMISHMDEWIGRIHQALADIGQLDNTLVIHTADHGLALGQHGFMGKQNLFEHSLNIPLIMAGPGVSSGLVSDALCYQHDLHPTLLEMAGARPEAGVFRSLGPILEGAAPSLRTHVGSSFQRTQRSIRDDRHKLIEYRLSGARHHQVFDLVKDPWETCDLANQPESEAVTDALRAALHRWCAEVDDPDWS